MSTLVNKLRESGHLNNEQVARVGNNVAEFMKVARSNPRFREEVIRKLAAAPVGPGTWGTVKNMMLLTGALTAAGAAVKGGEQLARWGAGKIRDSIMKGRYYKNMLDANPSLGDMDAKEVQRQFDTLYRFNPDYASDPNVAGSFVSDAANMQGVPIKNINDLVSARKNIVDTKSRGISDPSSSLPGTPQMGVTPEGSLAMQNMR